jgi:hypothetical protein
VIPRARAVSEATYPAVSRCRAGVPHPAGFIGDNIHEVPIPDDTLPIFDVGAAAMIKARLGSPAAADPLVA